MSTTKATASLKTISAALKLVDMKKENLKKAFEDLQAHSSLLSSFPLNWSDLDSHFSSAHSSLTRSFHRLESLQTDQPQPAAANDPSSLQQPAGHDRVDSVPDSRPALPEFESPQAFQNDPSSSHGSGPGKSAGILAPARPQLKAFCEKMDGKGLRRYIGELSSERAQIKNELPDAIRRAPDPAGLVLDAVEDFSARAKGDWDSELGVRRRICELLLETLMGMKQSVSAGVRERAKKLALEWKGKVNTNEDHMSLSMGFLLLMAAYNLVSYFDADELVDYLVLVSARHRQITDLIRALGLVNKVPDLVQKIISKGKQLLAVKFVFEFNLTDQFPPVPLLETYINETSKIAKKVRVEGKNSLKSLNEATAKELSALRSVIKIIEEHKLESEYPKDNLEKQIEQLEKEKANRKRPATGAPAAKAQQQNGSKRPRTTASVGPAAVPMNVAGSNSTISSLHHQPHPGLLSEHSAPYLSSAARPYGMVGSNPSAAPYAGSSAGPYGLVGSTPATSYAASSSGLYGVGGGPIGLPGNPSPAGSQLYSSDPGLGSQLYSSDPRMMTSYSDRPTPYDAYGVPPQYHPSYYPQ